VTFSVRVICLAIVFSLLALISPRAEAGSLLEHTASHSEIELLLENTALKPGEINWLAVSISPRDGWHSYWQNAGDSGAAPVFNWTLPQGITAGVALFGAPTRIPYAHLMNYGFNGSSALLIPFTVDTDFQGDAAEITVNGEWLVCEEICVPQVGDWQLTIPVNSQAGSDLVVSGLFGAARADLPSLAYWDAAMSVSKATSVLTVFADASELEGLVEAYFYPAHEGFADYAAKQAWRETEHGLVLEIPRSTYGEEAQNAAGVLELKFAASPTLRLALEPEFAGVVVAEAPDGSTASTTNVALIPLWQAALFAFLGGIILNLMPCVFPILSLKAFAFVKANYKTAKNRRMEGWAYTFGIWISFMAIVAVLVALRSGGAAIGWGFQMQDPIFVGLLALLMVLVSLSLAGVFTIQLGIEGSGQELASREGLQGSFFKGVLATLVATPCTAPLMAPAIGFALTQPIHIVILVFSLLALGLALPFLLLSYSARLASLMPKPGLWMEKVKQGLAFPMLATAAWLVYVFVLQAGAAAMLGLLLSAILIGFGVWLWGQSSSAVGRSIAALIVAVSITGTVYVSVDPTPPGQVEDSSILPYTASGLETLRAGGTPVFVYFTAEWCITCKVNEQVALYRDETQAAFKSKGIQVMKGDWTNRNDEIARVLVQHGRAGVPLYLYFPKDGGKVIVLPAVLTVSTIVDIL